LLIKIHNQTLPQIFNISLYKDLLIDTIINFKLKHLSGGQTRRLALFLALFYNPRIVFLDESFNDIDQRKITISIIKKYCQVHQIQIILISHSVYEISQLTNAGVFLVRNQKKSKIYSTQQLSKILVSQFKN
jgi:ABC-type multidrug transport system ATPase subunit